ncbi:MAG: RsmD family RNA methyltransferase [Solirubrobacterales bacterium]
MRVTGGELGGRRLRTPRRGAELRPTSDRVREAIFSILGDVSGARVLDLFCGTGALGIEALSRGAASVVMVDTKPAAARRNAQELGLGERAEVVRADAARFLRGAEQGAFDLVLCDPPYRLADRLARELDPLIRRTLAPGGRVVVESSPERPLPVALPVVRERRYGDTLVVIHVNPLTTHTEEPE